MPFHIPRHHHQQSLSDSQFSHDNYYGAANAIYSAGQTLSSVGAPASHWTTPSAAPTTASENRTYQQTNANGNGAVIPYRPGPAVYGGQTISQSESQSYPLPRRTLTIGRQPEELHLTPQGSAMSDVQHYGAPPAYGGDGVSIPFPPSTSQHPSGTASNQIPGPLQPGPHRPGPLATITNTTAAINNAPTLPTLPQISTQMQQAPPAAKPSSLNHTHSYSRSSPGAMDQSKYKPFSNTPDEQKFSSASANYVPHTPLGPSSYSPLGLADIRPRTDPTFPDTPFSPTTVQENEVAQYPSNSRYIAPWPIYALDWCKWPPRTTGGGAGKIAIGSYLEDSHNYVSEGTPRRWDIADGQVDTNSGCSTNSNRPGKSTWRARIGVYKDR